MGIPITDQYAAMLDAAAAGGYAYPAVNVTSSRTLNAAIRCFADTGSDGIVEVTPELMAATDLCSRVEPDITTRARGSCADAPDY